MSTDLNLRGQEDSLHIDINSLDWYGKRDVSLFLQFIDEAGGNLAVVDSLINVWRQYEGDIMNRTIDLANLEYKMLDVIDGNM